MKVISKEDLLTLLYYDDRNTFDETSFKNILSNFGDDWFIEDGEFRCFHKNENMNTIREHARRVKLSENQEIRQIHHGS